MHTTISLIPLQPDDREQFIRDNQDAFNYGAMEEFDLHDNHIEGGGEIISQATIEESIDNGRIQNATVIGLEFDCVSRSSSSSEMAYCDS